MQTDNTHNFDYDNSVKLVADAIRSAQAMIPELPEEDQEHGIEIRVCSDGRRIPNETPHIYTGDPSYDQFHHMCTTDAIVEPDTDPMALARQLMRDLYEDIETYLAEQE